MGMMKYKVINTTVAKDVIKKIKNQRLFFSLYKCSSKIFTIEKNAFAQKY